jgi:hypothetical protein
MPPDKLQHKCLTSRIGVPGLHFLKLIVEKDKSSKVQMDAVP